MRSDAIAQDYETAEAIPRSLAEAVSHACGAVSHNLAGQKLGRKGRITRERIIRAAIEVLEGCGDEPITLSAVARQASLGMSSLYNYFDDLTELVLAVLEPLMMMAETDYIAILRVYWPDEVLHERCLEYVGRYNRFWSRHFRLLHLRNTIADGLDERMLRHRLDAGVPVMRLLEQQMGRGDGAAPTLETTSMASVLTSTVERMATVATNPHYARLSDEVGPEVSHRLAMPVARLLELAIRDARDRQRQ